MSQIYSIGLMLFWAAALLDQFRSFSLGLRRVIPDTPLSFAVKNRCGRCFLQQINMGRVSDWQQNQLGTREIGPAPMALTGHFTCVPMVMVWILIELFERRPELFYLPLSSPLPSSFMQWDKTAFILQQSLPSKRKRKITTTFFHSYSGQKYISSSRLHGWG